MADLVIGCYKEDVSLSTKLGNHLTAKGALVVLNRQAQVRTIGEDVLFAAGVAPPKKPVSDAVYRLNQHPLSLAAQQFLLQRRNLH